MNNVFLLIKINIMNFFGINEFINTKSKSEKAKKILIGIVIVWAFTAVLIGSFAYFFMMANSLIMINQLNMLIVFGFLFANVCTLIFTILKASGYLFSFKDYDMLMSLPIKTSSILISKISFLYLTNFIGVIVFGMPPLIVYGITANSNALYYIIVIVLLLFVQVIPMIIGCVLSLIIAKISTKNKRGNLILSIGTFGVIIALFIVTNNIKLISTTQVQSVGAVFQNITNIYFITKIFLNATQNINLISFLMFIIINTLIFMLFTILFSRSFKNINADMNENYKVSKYDMSRLKQSSILMALYKKEISFYFSSFPYFINTGFGAVMMTFVAFGTAIFGKDTILKVLKIPELKGLIIPMFAAIMIFSIMLTFVTAPSISLEGKNIWIIKTLPIKYVDIIKSKILLSLTISVPVFIIDITVLKFALGITFVEYIEIVLVGILSAILSSITGIISNLLFPKLEWQSETEVVKQSASVLISSLLGFVYMLIIGGIFYLMKPNNFTIFLLVVIITLFILNILLWRIIKTKGEKIFLEIMG